MRRVFATADTHHLGVASCQGRLYSVQVVNTQPKDDSVTLGILAAVEESSGVTQRHLARHLGVALGLANSYLKRCVRKGLIKMQQAPANRYLYYLTPLGFAEKSRLTAEYLRYSLSFYRRASDSLSAVFEACAAAERGRVVLCGISDLAEIAVLRSTEFRIDIVAVYDRSTELARWMSRPVWRQLPPSDLWDICVVTDLQSPQQTWNTLAEQAGAEHVWVPDVLSVETHAGQGEQADVDAG